MSNNETAVLLISYDISDNKRRSRVVSWIEGQTHVKLSESVYAIDTALKPRAVLNLLGTLEQEDIVHVITQSRPFAGTEGGASVWLEDHLPVDQEEAHDQMELGTGA